MDILSNLTNLLGQAGGSAPAPGQQGGGGMGGLGELLNSDMLSGLVGALLSNKSGISGAPAGAQGGAGGGLGAIGDLLGALMGGGGQGGQGGGFLDQLMPKDAAPAPKPARAPSPASDSARAANMLRALVYAAKADGHIDDKEQTVISDQVRKLGLGRQAQAIIDEAVNEPLDPNRLARNVADADEAAQIYALSAAVTGMDHFMERNYLDALATALRIPPQVKSAVEARLGGR